MENWKDIAMEEDWAYKAGLVPFLSMGWETSMHNVMFKFLNTLLIKDAYIYFGHKDKVYVINKKIDYRCFWSVCERVCRRTERTS